MKRFEDLCRMTQQQLKNYMKQYLESKEYKPVCEDGFLYAKGTVPVLLVAHLDTVHKRKCEEIVTSNNKIYSPQGIGGDDRCGVFMIANIVKDLHCSVVLCEDEELGVVGAGKFAKTEYIDNLDVNYMIEFDRKGENDAVFYSCGNNEFIDFILDNTGYKEAIGSFTDISTLMPASKLCGVNLSCGYYEPHTENEYVLYDEMMNTISVAKALISLDCEKPFEYTAAKFNYTQSLFDNSRLINMIKKDIAIELEVVITDEYGEESIAYGRGMTKAECWFDLFTNYPYVCMNNISDYTFL